MKRQLKFRIWDTKACKGIGSSWRDKHPFNSTGIVAAIGIDGQLYYDGYHGMYKMTNDRYVIQQFTGLKDKNRKEIYEGDIIKATWKENNPYGYEPDEWRPRWEIKVVHYKAPMFILPANLNGFQRVTEDYELEVIGNIFENKELLV